MVRSGGAKPQNNDISPRPQRVRYGWRTVEGLLVDPRSYSGWSINWATGEHACFRMRIRHPWVGYEIQKSIDGKGWAWP